MVKKLKLDALILDKHKLIPAKAVYDPSTRIGEIKRGIRGIVEDRFEADPDHIYEMLLSFGKRKQIIIVDNASSKTISIPTVKKEVVGNQVAKEETIMTNCEVKETVKLHNDDPVDIKTKNKLNYLTQQTFWKSLMEKRKLPLSTVII
ncbi:MAG: hypothetical protein QXM86_03640 [Candidatus Bathyarchaeia archaeon]